MRAAGLSSLRRRVCCLHRVPRLHSCAVRVGWPGSIESASAIRSSPPSIRAGADGRAPDAVSAQAGKTNRIRTRRPIYQDGRAQCTTLENHGRLDQPSTLLRWSTAWSNLRGDEPRALGNHALLEVTPQRNEQSPCQRDDADAAHAHAPTGEARLIPLAKRAPGLEAQPQLGDLDDHRPDAAIARLADALITRAAPAVVGRAHAALHRIYP
jgi:hypothetical protein